MQHFTIGILKRLLPLIACGVGIGYVLASNIAPKWFWISIAVLLILLFSYNLFQYVSGLNRKISRFLESVRYSDFAIKFKSDNQLGKSFEELNRQLNEVLEAFRVARAEREANLQYLNAIVQHVSTGLISFDSSYRIELINNAALKLLSLYRLRLLTELQESHNELFNMLENIKIGTRYLYKTPNDYTLSIQSTTIQLRGKRVTIVALQNIETELQQKEVEAWQNLSRVLRHEIMNSLTPILSLVGTMRLIVDEDLAQALLQNESVADLQQALVTIENRSLGIIDFVNAYRDFTTLPKPNPRSVIVKILIEEALRLLSPEQSNITVVLDIEENLTIWADAEQIQQIIINLIKNAIEALTNIPNATIQIHAFVNHNAQKIIEIADNGVGIEPEVLETIFIPFFTTKKTGSGIGLSLSRQIMQQHGGQLTVTSQPQQGSSFRLIFLES